MVSDSTNEGFQCGEKGLNILHYVFTEGKSLDTSETDISLSFGRVHLESQFVSSLEEENFKVLDLSVGKHDDVLT